MPIDLHTAAGETRALIITGYYGRKNRTLKTAGLFAMPGTEQRIFAVCKAGCRVTAPSLRILAASRHRTIIVDFLVAYGQQ